MDKKGFTIGDIQPIVLMIVVIGVLFGAGMYVLTELKENNQISSHDTATAGIANVTEAGGDLASWLPIIVVVIAASIVIGIVITNFAGKTVA